MKLVKILWISLLLGALVALALGSQNTEAEEDASKRKVDDNRTKNRKNLVNRRNFVNIQNFIQNLDKKAETEESTDLGEDSMSEDSSTSSEVLDLSYYVCNSLNKTIGRCRPYEYCWKKEFYTSKKVFKNYVCAIPTNPPSIGVCCPDLAPVPEDTIQDETTTVAEMECGRSIKAGTRIVGGKVATPGEFPWIVSIMGMERFPTKHYCGGTLISPLHVITAAHCLDGNPPLNTSWVRLGEFDFNIEGESTHIERRVSNFLLHPDYNDPTNENDIAIVTLETPVRFNKYIRPACLPPPPEGDQEPYVGKMATVAGWGHLEQGGKGSSDLRKVSVPVMSQSDCKQYLGSSIYDNMMCAGFKEGGKDACHDDSGGPLMVKEGMKSFVIGLVSWGYGCAQANKPGVYTDVSKYLDWIKENTSQ